MVKKEFIFGILGLLLASPLWAEEALPEVQQSEIIVPIEVPEQMHYTWADFFLVLPCFDDFNYLQMLPFLSQEQQILKTKMQEYCIGDMKYIWGNLVKDFRTGKKKVLINKTLKENGTFWGYVKALPYFLFDVYYLQQSGNPFNDIQTAIYQKDPQKMVDLIKALPSDEQVFFLPVFNEAQALVDLKRALEGINHD